MEKEYITGLAALIGVLVGGTITSIAKWLELQYQEKKKENNYYLQNLNYYILKFIPLMRF